MSTTIPYTPIMRTDVLDLKSVDVEPIELVYDEPSSFTFPPTASITSAQEKKPPASPARKKVHKKQSKTKKKLPSSIKLSRRDSISTMVESCQSEESETSMLRGALKKIHKKVKRHVKSLQQVDDELTNYFK